MTSDFAAWTQAQDMHTVSLIAVLCAALHRCPQAVADAWHDALNSSVCQLPLLSALIFHMTGYVPSAQQVASGFISQGIVGQHVSATCRFDHRFQWNLSQHSACRLKTRKSCWIHTIWCLNALATSAWQLCSFQQSDAAALSVHGTLFDHVTC